MGDGGDGNRGGHGSHTPSWPMEANCGVTGRDQQTEKQTRTSRSTQRAQTSAERQHCIIEFWQFFLDPDHDPERTPGSG